MKTHTLSTAAWLATACLAAAPASAQDFTYNRIVQSGDMVDGRNADFFNSPVIGDDGTIVLAISDSTTGIRSLFSYSTTGTFNLLADSNTAAPAGGTLNFSDQIRIDGGNAYFNSRQGIYGVPLAGGSVITVVDDTTTQPDGSAWGSFQPLDVYGNQALFYTNSSLPRVTAIHYDADFTSNAVAPITIRRTDEPDPIDGTSTIRTIDTPNIGTGGYAYYSFDNAGRFALMGDFGSGEQVLLDSSDTAPNGGTFFGSFDPVVEGDTVYFASTTTTINLFSIYALDTNAPPGNNVTTIVDPNTPAPGGGTFASSNFASVDGGDVLFESDAGLDGLFFYDNETAAFYEVLGVGDTFDGKTVSSVFSIPGQALNNDTIVFEARFTDGSVGIYTASLIPEPSSLALLGLGGLLICQRRRLPA